jgi:CheY-like chemotaxis protein
MDFSAPPNSGSSPRRPRILIVDDDPVVLRAVRRLLRVARPGWEIEIADDGASALKRLERKSYDVVVTDLHMPAVDGVTLLGRLKTEQPEIVRVIHSSHVESLAVGQAEELAQAVLTKPSSSEELVRVLDWAFDQRRRRLRDSANF